MLLTIGACHHDSAHGCQYGWVSTSQPDPHSSVPADPSLTTTGVPHAWASSTGRPKPSPHEQFDNTSAQPITAATSSGPYSPATCAYWSVNCTEPWTPRSYTSFIRLTPPAVS